MIEIKINKDPREYKDKILGGLSLRQLICTILILGINIPLYIYGIPVLGESLTEYLLMIIALPLILIGFFEYNRMPFERVLMAMIESQFIRPVKRKYARQSIVALMDEYVIEQEILENKLKNKKRKKLKFKK